MRQNDIKNLRNRASEVEVTSQAAVLAIVDESGTVHITPFGYDDAVGEIYTTIYKMIKREIDAGNIIPPADAQ